MSARAGRRAGRRAGARARVRTARRAGVRACVCAGGQRGSGRRIFTASLSLEWACTVLTPAAARSYRRPASLQRAADAGAAGSVAAGTRCVALPGRARSLAFSGRARRLALPGRSWCVVDEGPDAVASTRCAAVGGGDGRDGGGNEGRIWPDRRRRSCCSAVSGAAQDAGGAAAPATAYAAPANHLPDQQRRRRRQQQRRWRRRGWRRWLCQCCPWRRRAVLTGNCYDRTALKPR